MDSDETTPGPPAGDESGSIASLGSFGSLGSIGEIGGGGGGSARRSSLWSALTAFLLLALVSSPPRGR